MPAVSYMTPGAISALDTTGDTSQSFYLDYFNFVATGLTRLFGSGAWTDVCGSLWRMWSSFRRVIPRDFRRCTSRAKQRGQLRGWVGCSGDNFRFGFCRGGVYDSREFSGGGDDCDRNVWERPCVGPNCVVSTNASPTYPGVGWTTNITMLTITTADAIPSGLTIVGHLCGQ